MENITYEKAYQFAIRIVEGYKYLAQVKKEFVLSKQLLRSGTSIGAILLGPMEQYQKQIFPLK